MEMGLNAKFILNYVLRYKKFTWKKLGEFFVFVVEPSGVEFLGYPGHGDHSIAAQNLCSPYTLFKR